MILIDKKMLLSCQIILAILLFLHLIADAVFAQNGCYGIELCERMMARRGKIEQLLRSPRHCIGEGLGGLLLVNKYNCSDEERRLAEAENHDRIAVFERMSNNPKMINKTSEEIGKEFAIKRQENLVKGVHREVKVPDTGETTWWDGYPPDPRKTEISRILTLKGATLYAEPNSYSAVARDNVQQYEAFGVLGSIEDNSGTRWYQVTEEYVPKIKPRNWSPKPIGWVAEDQVIPWRRAVVMRFTNPYNREPSLFFDPPQPILDLMQEAKDVRRRELQSIREQLENGRGGASGVVAMEPKVGAGQEQMIMYPVLDFHASGGKDDLFIDGKFARLLEVAARTRNSASESRTHSAAIDIIFVMDTTHSMRPYLENVLAATEAFADQHTDDGLRFGFIGYQDRSIGYQDNGNKSTKEFTSRTLLASEFVDALEQVNIDENSEQGDDFAEAVFDGVETALDSSQWRQEAIKIIFLVGDAPGREEDRVNKTTILRDKARTRKIRLFAFHIRNRDKESWKQYAELSSISEGIKGTAQAQNYWRSIDAGAAQFRQLIANEFQETLKRLPDVQEYARSGKPLPSAEPGSLSELIFQQATLMYSDNTLPAQDITGWVCDKVLTNPDREALTPMILLTETELEELTARVRELKAIGERALRGDGGTTRDFFELVSQNTKFTMVDPTAVTFRDAFAVPLGISELPYKSDIMAADRSDFDNPDRVQRFIRAMNNKLLHYEDLMRKRGDTTVWKKLSAGARDRDRVVGVELNQLP
ncbi:MAG: vWA domain-containing protein [Candidatus Electrothrix aestuarii]|uniref:VWA domain-containing protein n=1 Tax=Candidatus Electrothrix aestuarii TaxID=3062594 RepID=A0AAU8LZG1_9BACT|nr:vWA domain-containing protein [Candidatus Electrothrix aestuarii]